MDISKLVEDLNAEIRRERKPSFGETVYRDTPILRVASSLSYPEPQEYRMMRKLGATFDRNLYTESRIFYEQAKFMEAFEDRFEDKAAFSSFYPTYRVMSLRQQRTYFSWRTRLRRGELSRTDLSYVFVYLYELLNLIGSKTPAEAFDKLCAFSSRYGELDPSILPYTNKWLQDFVIYYGLPQSLLQNGEQRAFYRYCETLSNPEPVPDDSLFAALCALSTYQIENSKFYRAHPADFTAVCAAVYRSMHAFYAGNRKSTYFEHLFGKLRAAPYEMFSGAVLYDRRRHEDRTYEIDSLNRFVCCSGRWLRYGVAGGTETCRELGAFFRNVDALMREAFDYPFPTKTVNLTKQFESVVKQEIRLYKQKKAEAEKRVITIDFSILDQIRSASESTKEKILTEEEKAEDVPEAETPAPEPVCAESGAEENLQEETSAKPELTETERIFLRLLLENRDPAPFCRENGTMPSVLSEAVNEAFFDLFYDNVIDFSSDRPELVPDYRDELETMLGERSEQIAE